MGPDEQHRRAAEVSVPAALTEEWALALWCEVLPRMTEDALAGGWSDVLAEQVAAVAAGGSARTAFEDLGAPLTAARLRPDRSGPVPGAVVTVPGQDPVDLTGDYGCPTGRCPRRAGRNRWGEPPTCALSDAEMTFTPRRRRSG